MKTVHWSLIAIAILVITIACAGCSSTKNGGAGTTAPANTAAASSSGPASAAAAATATPGVCPTLNGKGTWDAQWDTYLNEDPCSDQRVRFYPATADLPDPWNNPAGGAGDIHVSVTLTQTGCDVTGSGKTVQEGTANAIQAGCPITFTGMVDSNGMLTGSWKAYCDFEFSSQDAQTGNVNDVKEDNGKFTLSMAPGGSTFIGSFAGSNAGESVWKSSECSGSNSNWAGKRS